MKDVGGLLHQCRPLFDEKVGNSFYVDEAANGDNIFIGYNSICENYNAVKVEGQNSMLQCVAADKSQDQTLESLKRTEGNGQKCYYDGVNGTSFDLSKCGFNTDGSGWCNKRRGDKWFTDALSQLKKIDFSKVHCHVSSTISTCSDLLNLNQTVLHEFTRAVTESDYDIGFANYAQNDKCVAKSITTSYWQEDFPDFAVLFKMPILALLLSLIFINL